jgi:hypothetical protein
MKCSKVVSEIINILAYLAKDKIKLYFVIYRVLGFAWYLLNGYLCPLRYCNGVFST